MKKIKRVFYQIICIWCGRDIDSIYQDNMSEEPGRPLCEDCYNNGDLS